MTDAAMTDTAPVCKPGRPWPGFFIVIEGIDGTGKSTLAAALAAALREEGRTVLQTFEPTRGPHGARLRQMAVSGRDAVTPDEEMALFIADRKEHLEQEILPALHRGETVIVDRYYYSTMAYQGARGVDPAKIEAAHRDFAPEPDLLVLLDLPVAEALHRITAKRGSTPDHFEGAEYLAKVREIFLGIARDQLMKIDARATTEEMVGKIRQAMASLSK